MRNLLIFIFGLTIATSCSNDDESIELYNDICGIQVPYFHWVGDSVVVSVSGEAQKAFDFVMFDQNRGWYTLERYTIKPNGSVECDSIHSSENAISGGCIVGFSFISDTIKRIYEYTDLIEQMDVYYDMAISFDKKTGILTNKANNKKSCYFNICKKDNDWLILAIYDETDTKNNYLWKVDCYQQANEETFIKWQTEYTEYVEGE